MDPIHHNTWDSIALDYELRVLSPLCNEVTNPLYAFIDQLPNRIDQTVADFGCGTGALLPFLSARFRRILAIDSSPAMIARSRERTHEQNVEYMLLDMRDLGSIASQVDVGISVNSIASPEVKDNLLMVRNISDCLREGGLFVAIFPSFDTVLYLRDLTRERYSLAGIPVPQIDQSIAEEFTIRHRMDEKNGLYADDEVHLQKFFIPNEIVQMLTDSGLSIAHGLEKVLYPWELTRRYGYGYFPGRPKIWDWFVVAKKHARSLA